MSRPDAELAVTRAEQLERRGELLVVVQRDHGELHGGGEFPRLNLHRPGEFGTEARIEREQLAEEYLGNEVDGRLDLGEAGAHELLLLVGKRRLGWGRAPLQLHAGR